MSAQTPRGFGPAPASWCWATLPAAASTQLWLDVAGWVGWLRRRYPLAERVPACWWRHTEVVEELTALWLAWQRAYVDPTAQLTGPIDFHSRFLPDTLARIREWGVHCDTEHRERPAFVYDHRAVDDLDTFHAHIGADVLAELAEPASPMTDRLTVAEVRDLTAAGAARVAADWDGAPLEYDGSLWISAGELYLRVADHAFAASLRSDLERLVASAVGVKDEAASGEHG